MTREEFIGKLRSIYVGEENAIDEIISEYDRLKDAMKKAFKIVDDKLTELNLNYGINNELREEYDELWEILKEKNND